LTVASSAGGFKTLCITAVLCEASLLTCSSVLHGTGCKCEHHVLLNDWKTLMMLLLVVSSFNPLQTKGVIGKKVRSNAWGLLLGSCAPKRQSWFRISVRAHGRTQTCNHVQLLVQKKNAIRCAHDAISHDAQL
jgi:hypothetical protein